ncbi:hypothetical protein U1Q18_029761 [Sarracenia purpurea var. burkii]
MGIAAVQVTILLAGGVGLGGVGGSVSAYLLSAGDNTVGCSAGDNSVGWGVGLGGVGGSVSAYCCLQLTILLAAVQVTMQ